MSLSITPYGQRPADPRSGSAVDVLSASSQGDTVLLAAASASAVLAPGFYRLFANANINVKFGSAVTNGANGEPWAAGQSGVLYFDGSTKVGVSAAS